MGRRSMALKIDVTDRDQVAAVFAPASVSPSRGRLPPAGSRSPHGQRRAEPGPRAVGSRGIPPPARDPSRLLRDAAAARPSAPRTVGPSHRRVPARTRISAFRDPDIGDR